MTSMWMEQNYGDDNDGVFGRVIHGTGNCMAGAKA